VLVHLPPHEKAQGIRDGLRNLGQFKVTNYGEEDWLGIAPLEPQPHAYLTARRLCDAATTLTPDTFVPLLEHPRYEGDEDTFKSRFEDGDWRTPIRRYADEMRELGTSEAQIGALRATFLSTPLEEVPAYLCGELPKLFAAFPEGSLWMIDADELLNRRLTLLRMLVSQKLAPEVYDLNIGDSSAPHFLTLNHQSLTRGLDLGHVIDPLLLAFYPATLGFTMQWMPSTVVFLTGQSSSMLAKYPATPWALYDPGFQSPVESMADRYADFIIDVGSGPAESLLQWWVTRLNIAYSFLLNPTNFDNGYGNHEPMRQLAWFLTFERLIVDLLLIDTGFSQSELARQISAFDLLDKAETLLGYDRKSSGAGFESMLLRSRMLPRLEEVWANLPVQARQRFRSRATRLYDELYEGVREHTYPHRLTRAAVKVISEKRGKTVAVPTEMYTARLVRALRNSRHGFIDVLTNDERRWDRALLAAHDGYLPSAFPDLVALLAFAMIADFDSVTKKAWLPN